MGFPDTSIQLNGAELINIDQLRTRASRSKNPKTRWECGMEVCRIINEASLTRLNIGAFENNEELIYTDLPRTHEEALANGASNKKGAYLHIGLVEGSELYQKILKLLEDDFNG